MNDKFIIGGKELNSRLFIGTGKYSSNEVIKEVIKRSEAEVITLALRRVDLDNMDEDILCHIPKEMVLLPNTSGARNAEEAVRIARLGRAMGLGNWVKIEVINDSKYLLPDNIETLKATEILSKEGFMVFPYMNPDLTMGRYMLEAGATAIMPLGAPIGSNRGLKTKEIIKIMIEEIDAPIIVDAGIGKPSQGCEAMEIGASAVLVNTALSSSENPLLMAKAFNRAIKAGREAYLAGQGIERNLANPSSPLTGFLD